MSPQQGIQRQTFDDGFVDLIDIIMVERRRKWDAHELQDFVPFIPFGKIQFGGCVERIGSHFDALNRFAAKSLAQQHHRIIQPLIDLLHLRSVRLGERTHFLFGDSISLFQRASDLVDSRGHD